MARWSHAPGKRPLTIEVRPEAEAQMSRTACSIPGAALAVIGADVEIRQRSIEQERAQQADRVAVIEDGDAVLSLHPLDLGGERGVVRLMEERRAAFDVRSSGTGHLQIGWSSKSVSGTSPVVFWPG